MIKARFTLTVTMEVEIKPENYLPKIPLTATNEERIAYDILTMKENTWVILDSDNAVYNVTGELLEEESK